VTGAVGVLFFFLNSIFAAILLIMLIVSSVFAIVYKNPDARYQPMRDDRGSFIKSQTNLNTELDALGATARGDMAMKRDLDDDSDSFMSAPNSMARQQHDASGVPLPHSSTGSMRGSDNYHGSPDAATPFMANHPSGPHRNASPAPRYGGGGGYNSGYGGYSAGGYNDYNRSGSMQSQGSYRPYNGGTSSPWQRGAGYDH
jgi:Transient receptor potential (TRP) ion channel